MGRPTSKSNYISSKIKELRNECKWSQSELAKQSGVTASAISMIESCQRVPSLVVIRKISDALKVSVSELTGEVTQDEAAQSAQAFFRQFKDLNDLNEEDQKIIMNFVKRLKEKSGGEGKD